MKIHELMRDIANKVQPNHIRFRGEDWYWGYDSYIPEAFLDNTPDTQVSVSLFRKYRIEYCLNDDVEVIEEPKKIERISWSEKESLAGNLRDHQKQEVLTRRTEKLKKSLNEIIDILNMGED